jgi:hypothetical protein
VSHNLGREEDLSPSNFVRRHKWILQTLRSVVRECRPPRKFSNYMFLMSNIIDVEPSNFEEVSNQQVWWDSMVDEYTYIMRNDVWYIVLILEGNLVVISRCLYKIKHVRDGSIEKLKVRFVVTGFSQKEGVDYEETIVPVSSYASIQQEVYI